MTCYISVRDIDFHSSSDGVRIRVTTDVASHLWLRLSSKHPWVHRKPSLRRGVAFAEDVRFCFTVFEDNEQEETGDTLNHTWWKPNWPICTTKWLYVWGMRAGETCVSTTAPFKYHNDGISPVPHVALLLLEPWTGYYPPPPTFELVFLEPWTLYSPGMEELFVEPWTS